MNKLLNKVAVITGVIAKTAMFLASTDLPFILSTEIIADGGMSQL
jgi:hypothetical protein